MSLRAEDVTLEIGGTRVLEHINVAHQPGAIVAILGPNGAGKSSLLRVLCGEWRPSTGRATLHDKPLAAWPARDLATTLAVLPQQCTLDFAFTVDEVVRLGRTPHASGAQHDEEIAREALATLDATHLATRLYTQLSGGEKQRINLARVLAQVWETSAHGARYVLLDEPSASLDLAHQHLMLAVLRRLAADGVGVVVVLHDLNLAARSADTMILLKDGQIAAQGDPHSVLQVDVIRDVFDVETSVAKHPRSGTPLVIL